LNDQRRANARRLAEALRELRNILLPTVRADALRAYARFPLRIVDPQMRRDVVQLLNTHGIGASTSYPLCLADVPEVRAIIPPSDADMPGARELAAQIVTLPTHGYCQPDLGRRVRSLLREYGA
jgi:dTDP-4-amino-4,6-dideoxygalactose transaminase